MAISVNVLKCRTVIGGEGAGLTMTKYSKCDECSKYDECGKYEESAQ